MSRRQEQEESSGLLLAQERFSPPLQCGEKTFVSLRVGSSKEWQNKKGAGAREGVLAFSEKGPLTDCQLGLGAAGTEEFFTPEGAAAPAFGLGRINDGPRWNSVSGPLSQGATSCPTRQVLLSSQ